MKIGFLTISQTETRAKSTDAMLFDKGHSVEAALSISSAENLEWALSNLRTICECIVICGDTSVFYSAYQDRLGSRTDSFELDGKLYAVTENVSTAYVTDKLIPLLNSKAKTLYNAVIIKTYNKTEAELRVMLKDHIKNRNKIVFGFFPGLMECEVHIRYSSKMAKAVLDEKIMQVGECLLGCAYAFEPISIQGKVASMLIKNGLKLKIAESFTGGALAKAFTSMPGASAYLVEDVVTYSNESKISRLGVNFNTINRTGAVSSDTAFEMACGLLNSRDCDVVVATTGNAGPTAMLGGEVGLCHIAVGDVRGVHVFKRNFSGDRESVIESGVAKSLFILYEYLAKYELEKAAAIKTESK